ncbi:hypothetical protein H0H92_014473 [Tricholoma furcatifolium]|nr:hypothetical protein H0H92_014473 [Tricholoma furcatifolium]
MAALRPRIRLVTLDALYTLVVPRLPIHVQYSQTFEPYLGVLDPASIKQSFRTGAHRFKLQSLTLSLTRIGFGAAFKSMEIEFPVYVQGSHAWWSEVIKRTALGAGANANGCGSGSASALDKSLSQIVSQLLDRFSSKKGYKAYDDAIPFLHALHELNVRTAVVSNADSRIRSVLRDLDFPVYLEPIILSEEARVEKPAPDIFRLALSTVNCRLNDQELITPAECLHVGDEVDADYYGAQAAGMQALLLRRNDSTEPAHKIPKPLEDGVAVVEDLPTVVHWVLAHNT